MDKNLKQTGFLNYFIPLDNCKEFLTMHPIRNEIIKFKPKQRTQKAFRQEYSKFLTHKDKLDLTKFGFRAETVSSEAFGTKTFYKTDIKFFWAEIFEAVHLGYL